ncbi:MAG: efflux transporter outer membrane subunit [Chlamydiae bacterium]|nr:efflux transporter outer membrane subunit [Chlamydiota bacterium]
MVGPNYHEPEVCLPNQYEEMKEDGEEVNLSCWWTIFELPHLNEMIEEGLAKNLDLNIALEKIEELRAIYRVEVSKLFPQISGNALASRFRRSPNISSSAFESITTEAESFPTVFSGPLVQNFFQAGLDAVWELDFFGKNRRAKRAAFHDMEASRENAWGVQIILVADIAKTYFDGCAFQDQILIVKEQIERQTALLDLAKSRYDAGLISDIDVAELQADLEEQKSILPPLETILKQAIFELAILLGKQPEAFEQQLILTAIEPIPLSKWPTSLPSDLLRRRPDIRKAERELAAATERIGVAKAELFPTFSLLANFGFQSSKAKTLFDWTSRFWEIGPSMIVSLFDAGKLRAQVNAQTSRQKQALFSYEQTILNSLKEVEGSFIAYFKEENRFAQIAEKVSSNQKIREYAFDLYVSGLTSLSELLIAEKTLFNSKIELTISKQTLAANLIALYKALGGGW